MEVSPENLNVDLVDCCNVMGMLLWALVIYTF